MGRDNGEVQVCHGTLAAKSSPYMYLTLNESTVLYWLRAEYIKLVSNFPNGNIAKLMTHLLDGNFMSSSNSLIFDNYHLSRIHR